MEAILTLPKLPKAARKMCVARCKEEWRSAFREGRPEPALVFDELQYKHEFADGVLDISRL